MPTVQSITVTTIQAPELLIAPDGLRCPYQACGALNELVEQDYCIRHNNTEVDVRPDGTHVYVNQGQQDFETAAWVCNKCGNPAAMPTTVDVDFS